MIRLFILALAIGVSINQEIEAKVKSSNLPDIDTTIFKIRKMDSLVYLIGNPVPYASPELIKALFKKKSFYDSSAIDSAIIGVRIDGETYSLDSVTSSIEKGSAQHEEYLQKVGSFKECQEESTAAYLASKRYLRLLVSAKKELEEGVQRWVHKASNQFIEWTLEERFYNGKFYLKKANEDGQRLYNAAMTCDGLYVEGKLREMLLIQDSLEYFMNQIEDAAKRSPREIGPMTMALRQLEWYGFNPLRVLISSNGVDFASSGLLNGFQVGYDVNRISPGFTLSMALQIKAIRKEIGVPIITKEESTGPVLNVPVIGNLTPNTPEKWTGAFYIDGWIWRYAQVEFNSVESCIEWGRATADANRNEAATCKVVCKRFKKTISKIFW